MSSTWVILDHRDDTQVGSAQNESDAMQLARDLLNERRYAVDVYEVDEEGKFLHVDLVTTQDEERRTR